MYYVLDMKVTQRKVITSIWDGQTQLYRREVLELSLEEEIVKVCHMDLEKWRRIHRDIDEQEDRETSLCKIQHGARWGLSTGACKEQGRDKAGGDCLS